MSRKSIKSLLIISIFVVCGCHHESLTDKAEKTAKEYNRRYCPTPAVNYIRTDSIAFDKAKQTFTYYCSFCDLLDDEAIVELNKEKIGNALRSSVTQSTSMKPYVEAGFHFKYVCHSDKNPKQKLYEMGI